MLTSKEGKQQSFSFSIKKFMLGGLDGKFSLNLSAWSREENSANMSSMTVVSVETLEELK